MNRHQRRRNKKNHEDGMKIRFPDPRRPEAYAWQCDHAGSDEIVLVTKSIRWCRECGAIRIQPDELPEDTGLPRGLSGLGITSGKDGWAWFIPVRDGLPDALVEPALKFMKEKSGGCARCGVNDPALKNGRCQRVPGSIHDWK